MESLGTDVCHRIRDSNIRYRTDRRERIVRYAGHGVGLLVVCDYGWDIDAGQTKGLNVLFRHFGYPGRTAAEGIFDAVDGGYCLGHNRHTDGSLLNEEMNLIAFRDINL